MKYNHSHEFHDHSDGLMGITVNMSYSIIMA